MTQIIIINGTGESGKDTFVKYCAEYLTGSKESSQYLKSEKDYIKSIFEGNLYSVLNISTVDYVKIIANKLGWDGEKDEKSRKFLSDLKDVWNEYNSGPFNFILENIKEFEEIIAVQKKIVFVHSREPNEIERFKNYFNDKCLTVLVRRNEPIKSNHADSNIEEYNYDVYIENRDTLKELYDSALKFCNNYILKEN